MFGSVLLARVVHVVSLDMDFTILIDRESGRHYSFSIAMRDSSLRPQKYIEKSRAYVLFVNIKQTEIVSKAWYG